MNAKLVRIGKLAATISNSLEKVVGWFCIAITAVMVMDVLLGIVARYIFNSPFTWAEELGRYTMIYAAFLAFGIALKRGEHVGLTILVEKMPPALVLPIDMFGRLSIGYFLMVMTVKGIELCKIVAMQTSPGLQVNMAWVMMIIPISSILQLLFLVLMTLEDAGHGFHGRLLAVRSQETATH